MKIEILSNKVIKPLPGTTLRNGVRIIWFSHVKGALTLVRLSQWGEKISKEEFGKLMKECGEETIKIVGQVESEIAENASKGEHPVGIIVEVGKGMHVGLHILGFGSPPSSNKEEIKKFLCAVDGLLGHLVNRDQELKNPLTPSDSVN